MQAVIDQVRATPAVERSLVGWNSRSFVLQVRVRWSIPMPTRTTRSMAGDVFQTDFRACQAQDGSGKYDGKFVMTVQNVTGNTEGHAAKLAFTSLKVEQAEFRAPSTATCCW